MPQSGREVVIVEAARTPVGRGHPEKGYYKETHPNELLGRCYSEVIERAGIDAHEVEDVVAGCVQQYGEQMFNVGRNAWLQAGLPVETPATTVDRQCGSAQQAVNFAAALIAAAAAGAGAAAPGAIAKPAPLTRTVKTSPSTSTSPSKVERVKSMSLRLYCISTSLRSTSSLSPTGVLPWLPCITVPNISVTVIMCQPRRLVGYRFRNLR